MPGKILEKLKSFFAAAGRISVSVFKWVLEFVKKHKIISIIIVIVLILAIVLATVFGRKGSRADLNLTEYTVSKMNIKQSISGSSNIEANNAYTVTPLVTGEILQADFEEGDQVEKDQILYVIDSSDVENSLKSAELSLEKAQTAYNKALNSHADEISKNNDESNRLSMQRAQNSYYEAMDMVNDLNVSAGFSGTISEVYVNVGDDVANGTKIADIVDSSTMKARVPFNTVDAERIWVGQEASVTLVNSGTVLYGNVTAVSSGSETVSGNVRISYITIEVQNPGAVLEGDKVTAMIDDMACNDVGQFEAVQSRSILSKVQGTVSGVWVVKGDYVLNGSTVVTIDSENVDDTVRDAEIAYREAQIKQANADYEKLDSDDYTAKLRSARISLDEAFLQQDKVYKQLESYTIKSPISGTVVAKSKKAGEKIESGSASSTNSNALAIIYDMSSLCVNLDVDELDVMKVKVGQEATITADAVENKTYKGVVENVSINGTIGTNGVTTYPVKIRINDFDDQLLPGMNIDVEIVVKNVSDVLSVPVNAINRGNTVYVKGDKEDENDMAPDGFKTVQVTTGISNDKFVEIVSGLSEGDIIYVAPSAGGNQMQMPGMFGGMPSGGMPGGGMNSRSFGGMSGGMPSGGMSGGMSGARSSGGGMR